MTFSEYRETYSWQGAIELGPQLMRLAEELPAAEEMGLSLHLRQLMVELPASIAADLIKGRDASMASALKLLTVLELIDRVYPALDTAATRSAADTLAARLASGNFNERQGGPTPDPSAVPPETAPLHEPPAAPAATPVVPTEMTVSPEGEVQTASPAPATTTVTVVTAPDESAAPASAVPTSEETNVRPDSVQ